MAPRRASCSPARTRPNVAPVDQTTYHFVPERIDVIMIKQYLQAIEAHFYHKLVVAFVVFAFVILFDIERPTPTTTTTCCICTLLDLYFLAARPRVSEYFSPS